MRGRWFVVVNADDGENVPGSDHRKSIIGYLRGHDRYFEANQELHNMQH